MFWRTALNCFAGGTPGKIANILEKRQGGWPKGAPNKLAREMIQISTSPRERVTHLNGGSSVGFSTTTTCFDQEDWLRCL